ncbi:hypothetical protein MFIFM68171_05312 [Madurella fahalii]|uniref:Uncharacterized protein n=1 Tax=Madurella fahalii TaxID=1157608 RepID=A0ABQ0GBI7_9PEZI
MSAICTIAGNPDTYGLGIRTAVYLLWYAVLIGERLSERHARTLRGAELILASVIFLGLAMTATAGHLHAAEVYIALLLVSGTVYLLVPRHTTDLVAWIHPKLRPRRQGDGFGIATVVRCLFVVIVIGLHLWFWTTGVDSASIDRALREQFDGCRQLRQVGFAFGPVELRSGGFRALNILLMLALLAGGVLVGAMKARVMGKKRSRRRRRANKLRLAILREIETVGGLGLASVLVAGIELSIQWNGVPAASVNQVSTAAQLVPLLFVNFFF